MSKVKFRQGNNLKRVLEADKLGYANKTEQSIISQNLDSRDFWGIANNFHNKGKSAIPPLFNKTEVLPSASASDKMKLFSDNFCKKSNLDDPGIFLPAFAFRTNLKLHNISITPNLIRKIITNLLIKTIWS